LLPAPTRRRAPEPSADDVAAARELCGDVADDWNAAVSALGVT
jgi:hypothetical protein